MGTRAKEPVISGVAVTSAYDSGATTGAMLTSDNDEITLLVTMTGTTLTTLTMRFLEDGKPFYKAVDGALVLDEVVHTFGDRSFAFKVNTVGVNSLEVQFKGNASADTITVEQVQEGTSNRAPVA